LLFAIPIFPNYRTSWIENIPTIEEKIAELEFNLNRRNSHLPAHPKGKSVAYKNEINLFYREFGEFSNKEKEHVTNLEICWNLARKLVPLIRTANWVRWFDLEKGLAIAFDSENILSSTLITRTLAEETIRGMILENNCQTLINGDISHRDMQMIGKNFKDWGLPRIEKKSIEEITKKSRRLKKNASNSEIIDLKNKLNDYVHPNYGSHRIVLDPLNTSSPELFISSLNSIFDNFFKHPWLDTKHTVKSKKQIYIKKSINEIDRKLSIDKFSGFEKIINTENIMHGLNTLKLNHKEKNSIYEKLVEDEISEIQNISDACFNFPTFSEFNKFYKNKLYPFESLESSWYWIGSIKEYLSLSDKSVEKKTIKDLVQKIRLISLLSNLKKAILIPNIQLSIIHDLPLTSSILSRSLYEFHSVSIWISTVLDELTKKLINNSDIDGLFEIDRVLGLTLFGGRSTFEGTSQLREEWIQLFGIDSINTDKLINSLPESISYEYNALSQSIHGEILRGADLLGDGKDELIRYISARIISNIGYLTADLSAVSAEIPLLATTRLSKLQFELNSGKSFKEACDHLHIPGKLALNKDFFGEGTEADPIIFRDGLFYHEAYQIFCNQNNIVGVSYSYVEQRDDKTLWMLKTKDELDYFFLVSIDEYDKLSD